MKYALYLYNTNYRCIFATVVRKYVPILVTLIHTSLMFDQNYNKKTVGSTLHENGTQRSFLI
jgi:hypothetical protein